MNENERCAANGCPLVGTRKSATNGEGAWFCSCHFNRDPSANDAITLAIRTNSAIGRAAMQARREGAASYELEAQLVELTRDIGKKLPLRTTVPTAPVIGPMHASAYFGEVDA